MSGSRPGRRLWPQSRCALRRRLGEVAWTGAQPPVRSPDLRPARLSVRLRARASDGRRTEQNRSSAALGIAARVLVGAVVLAVRTLGLVVLNLARDITAVVATATRKRPEWHDNEESDHGSAPSSDHVPSGARHHPGVPAHGYVWRERDPSRQPSCHEVLGQKRRCGRGAGGHDWLCRSPDATLNGRTLRFSRRTGPLAAGLAGCRPGPPAVPPSGAARGATGAQPRPDRRRCSSSSNGARAVGPSHDV